MATTAAPTLADLANLKTWQEKAGWAQARRTASLAKVEPPLAAFTQELPVSSQDLPKALLTAREIEITEKYSVIELLAILKEKKISVEEVTRAFLRRAAVAHLATNCLTELLWDQAIARAKHLDSLPEPKGALFGLPISAKEHHGMVGTDITSNASFVAWIGKKHGSNALYDLLWEEGCVFFVRTTQPQTIMHLETESNVWGLTVNPYNRNLTPGGSSGGEGAIIGMRGSIFGIGGDIGGSIRCPAAHCGVYGFKPSLKRFSGMGQCSPMAGKETIQSTLGPLTVDRDALDLFMRVAVSAQMWKIDPSVNVTEWKPYTFTKPIKVAVQWWDGVVRPHPPMLRAMKEVAEACRKAGMTVVDWDSETVSHAKCWDIVSALYWPDGGKEAMDTMKATGEPVLPLTKFIIEEQPTVKDMTQHELWKLCCERDQYRVDYALHWNKSAADDGQEVDIILCPPSFGAAIPHGQSRYWGYTSQWNLLDYPGVVFPVTTVDPVKDPRDTSYVPKNDQDKFAHEMYSPEKFANAPVSLQLIGRRQHDEKVLAALVEIEHAMGRK